MENLKDEVVKDMKTAMVEKNADKLVAIRAVKAAIDKYEKENPGDSNYAKALKPLIKQRTDSAEAYKVAGSLDLASKEEAEMAIINTYLLKVQPKQMRKEEIEAAVKKCVADNNLGKNDMGKVMSFFKANHDGLYDGKELSSIVRNILS